MPGIDIKLTNADKIIQGLNDRVKNIEATLEKTGKQMGVLATNEIHPLTNKKTGNWDSTIHAEVKKIGAMKYELWVGSKGAFTGVASAISYGKATKTLKGTFKKNVKAAQKSGAGVGYNYGARQERLNHPIERGWQAAQAPMKDLFQRNITAGLGGKSITQNVAPSNIDEMANMAGF